MQGKNALNSGNTSGNESRVKRCVTTVTYIRYRKEMSWKSGYNEYVGVTR
jgi:hypothetical protein